MIQAIRWYQVNKTQIRILKPGITKFNNSHILKQIIALLFNRCKDQNSSASSTFPLCNIGTTQTEQAPSTRSPAQMLEVTISDACQTCSLAIRITDHLEPLLDQRIGKWVNSFQIRSTPISREWRRRFITAARQIRDQATGCG